MATTSQDYSVTVPTSVQNDGDLYGILGISKAATPAEIKKAWRLKSLTAHPDKTGCDEWMKNLNKALTLLLDPEKRAKYDDQYEDTDDNAGVGAIPDNRDKYSEDLRLRIEEWQTEFSEYDFLDNFEDGRIYKEVFEQLEKTGEDLVNTDTEYYRKFISFYEDKYRNYLKRYEKQSLQSKLITAFSDVWKLERSKCKSNGGDLDFREGRYLEALSWYVLSEKTGTLKKKAEELVKMKKYDVGKIYYIALHKKDPSADSVFGMLSTGTLQSGFGSDSMNEAILTAASDFMQEQRFHGLAVKVLYHRQKYIEVVGAGEVYGRNNDELETDVLSVVDKSKEQLEQEAHALIRGWLDDYSAGKDGELKRTAYYLKERGFTTVSQLYYEEFTRGIKNMNELHLRQQSAVLILKGYYFEQKMDFVASLRSYQEAVILLPTEEVYTSVAILLNTSHTRALITSLLEQLGSKDISIPVLPKYVDRIQSNNNLTLATKSERAIHNGRNNNISSGLLYIDLCMTAFDTTMVCSNFTLASAFFLQEMKQFQFSTAAENGCKDMSALGTKNVAIFMMYALRNAIRELCDTTVARAKTNENPITELHFVKLCFILAMTSNELFRDALIAQGQLNTLKKHTKSKPLLELQDCSLVELISRSLNRLVKITPFVDTPITLAFDFMYIDLVATGFLEVYYNTKTLESPRSHLYQYGLLDLAWKCLPFDDGQKFDQYRQKSMKPLLDQRLWTVQQVEFLMEWNVLNRDSNGFLDPTKPWLNLPGENFDSVDGVVVNTDDGTFSLIMTPSPQTNKGNKMEHTGLFNMADVLEVLRTGIQSSFFTLSQANFDMQSHPFQEMRFSPKNMSSTNFLRTQLHADLLLKYLSTGAEVSAKSPFMFKPVEAGLLNMLPEYLREFVATTAQRKNGKTIGNSHRFWIESGELMYDASDLDNGSKLIYLFGKCHMKVKTHLLKYDAQGELKDDEKEVSLDEDYEFDLEELNKEHCIDCGQKVLLCSCDEEDEEQTSTAEKEFANDMTIAYDHISRYFRLFPRLRELYKLQAVCRVLGQAYRDLQNKKNAPVDFDKVESSMNDLYAQVKGFNVSDANINQVSTDLAKGYDIPNDSRLKNHVSNCLKNGQAKELALYISSLLEDRSKTRFNRFSDYCRKFGVDFNIDEKNFEMNDPNERQCIWVPSTYYRNHPTRVYGGVSMDLKMKLHKENGDDGNPKAFNMSTIKSLDGGNSINTRTIKAHINRRAALIANKSFSGITSNFRSKSKTNPYSSKREIPSVSEAPFKTRTFERLGIRKVICRSQKSAYETAKVVNGGTEPEKQWNRKSGWHYLVMEKVGNVKRDESGVSCDENVNDKIEVVQYRFPGKNPPGEYRIPSKKLLRRIKKLEVNM